MSLVGTIETASGNFLSIIDPNPDHINLGDITFVLSRMGRFGGHAPIVLPYSVAQHSSFCVELLLDYVQGTCPPGRTLVFDKFLAEKLPELNIDDIKKSVNKTTLMHVLMHDASEAYLVDLPTPIKRIPGIKEAYLALETKMMEAIYTKFKLPAMTPVEQVLVHMVDGYSLCVEAYHMMPSRGKEWNLPLTIAHADKLRPLKVHDWEYVRDDFQSKFCDLYEG